MECKHGHDNKRHGFMCGSCIREDHKRREQMDRDALRRQRDDALARAEKAEAEVERTMAEWELMYAGRECPRCGYHVTMNVESSELCEVLGITRPESASGDDESAALAGKEQK